MMLNKALHKLMALLLGAVVLVSTSGFSIYEHTCKTEHSRELSILIPEFSCAHEHQPDHEALLSCCALKDERSTGACHNGECCDTDVHLVKLDIPFDYKDIPKKNFSPCIFTLAEPVENEQTEAEAIRFIYLQNNLPPPLSGKEIRIFLHQLSIPHHTV